MNFLIFRMHVLPLTPKTKFHQDIVQTILQAADKKDLKELDFLKSVGKLYYEFHENRKFLIVVAKWYLFYSSLYSDYSTVLWKTSLRILRDFIRPWVLIYHTAYNNLCYTGLQSFHNNHRATYSSNQQHYNPILPHTNNSLFKSSFLTFIVY